MLITGAAKQRIWGFFPRHPETSLFPDKVYVLPELPQTVMVLGVKAVKVFGSTTQQDVPGPEKLKGLYPWPCCAGQPFPFPGIQPGPAECLRLWPDRRLRAIQATQIAGFTSSGRQIPEDRHGCGAGYP
jgi:hypothetical protein